MIVDLNAYEIFEIAERLERNGAMFYRKAAEYYFENAELRMLLLDIAETEDEHEKVFAKMRRQLTSESRRVVAFDTLEDMDEYIKTLADRSVFDVEMKPEDVLTGNESAADIVKLAIKSEKDAIVYYVGLKNLIYSHATRDRIEEIISEEMDHIGRLRKQLTALNTNPVV